VLCLPFLRWMHRFERPLGIPYPNTWEDRLHNYLVGFGELGLPTEALEAHFAELLGEKVAEISRVGVQHTHLRSACFDDASCTP